MNRIAWLVFGALQVAAWLTYHLAWMTSWWFDARLGLGIASVAVALLLLARGQRSKAKVLLLVVGLLVGQWHLWSGWLAQAIWRYRGFAP